MNKIIILNNKKCQIITDDLALLQKLKRLLSFKATGVEYTAAYKNGWNGITYLLSKTNKFDLGLLNKVKVFLQDQKINFKIDDLRSPKTINAPIEISDKLKKINMVPRDHQLRILNATNIFERGIVRAATGSGKTLVTALITAKINKPTIIYVIGLDLLQQFHTLFSQIFDEKIGWIGNGICDPQRITIASIWTIGKALSVSDILDEEDDLEEKDNPQNYEKIKSCLAKTKLHIFDESHIVTCNTILEIYKNIDPEYIYGFSGTPFRDDNSDLLINGILGEQIVNVSASELIEKKLLAMPIIKFYSVPKKDGLSNQYQSVYKEYIVENDIRNNLIINVVKEMLLKEYTPLVLFKQIKHGNIISDLLLKEGIKFEMLQGNDSLEKRNIVKKKLINKEINVILASTIFDIGVDLPELSALVLCGGGKSSIRSLQRIGRVIRLHNNKKYAAIADFYDQARFLKSHSIKRFEVYSSENGFKVIKSREMKSI
jgi:superfamily II DNA or RNA helicase